MPRNSPSRPSHGGPWLASGYGPMGFQAWPRRLTSRAGRVTASRWPAWLELMSYLGSDAGAAALSGAARSAAEARPPPARPPPRARGSGGNESSGAARRRRRPGFRPRRPGSSDSALVTPRSAFRRFRGTVIHQRQASLGLPPLSEMPRRGGPGTPNRHCGCPPPRLSAAETVEAAAALEERQRSGGLDQGGLPAPAWRQPRSVRIR